MLSNKQTEGNKDWHNFIHFQSTVSAIKHRVKVGVDSTFANFKAALKLKQVY